MAIIGKLPIRGFTVGEVSTVVTRGFDAATPSTPVVTVTCPSTTTGTVGTAFSSTASASGGTAPYTFAVGSGALPTGLSMSIAGVISGTPTVAGSFAFSISAIDALTVVGSTICSIDIAAVAPNTTPETCISLTLPATIEVDLHYATGDGLWYCYTPNSEEFYLGIKVFPNPPVTYQPFVAVWTDNGTVQSEVPGFANAVKPAQQAVIPTTPYWFSFSTSGTPPLGTMASFTVVACPNEDAPAGTMFIPDDSPGFPGVLLDTTTGEVIRAIPFPAGEAGTVLPNGTMAVEAQNSEGEVASVNIYTQDFVLVTAIPTLTLFGVSTITGFLLFADNYDDTFFVAWQQHPEAVYPISDAGVVGAAWVLPGAYLSSMAASPDGAILYWAGNNSVAVNPVFRYDLVNSTPLSDLAAGIATHTTGEMMSLGDGSVLVVYRSGAPDMIKRYSAAGSVLNTYTLADYAGDSYDHLARASDDPDSFWLWKLSNSGTGTISNFTNILTSDGSIVHTFQVDNFEIGQGIDGTTQDFGPSKSCPFFLLTQPTNPPPPTPVPFLAINKVQNGSFTRGQVHATYQIAVSNNGDPTSASVVVHETIPSGLTLVSMAGTGWTCVGNVCCRHDVLGMGETFPLITVTVNVAADATSPQVNLVTVTSGDLPPASATVSTPLSDASNACIATLPLG